MLHSFGKEINVKFKICKNKEHFKKYTRFCMIKITDFLRERILQQTSTYHGFSKAKSLLIYFRRIIMIIAILIFAAKVNESDYPLNSQVNFVRSESCASDLPDRNSTCKYYTCKVVYINTEHPRYAKNQLS